MFIRFTNGSFTTSQDGDGGTLNSGTTGTLAISAGQILAAANNGGLQLTTVAPGTLGVTQNAAGIPIHFRGTFIAQARGSA